MQIKKNSARKFVFEMFKDHKKELIVITIISTIGALFSVLIPYIYGKLFDFSLIPNTTTSILLSLILIWALLGLISTYATTKTSFLGEILGNRVALKSEAEAYGHFLTLPISFHKNKKSGSILQKISHGSWNLVQMIELSSEVFPQFMMLIFACFNISFVKPKSMLEKRENF